MRWSRALPGEASSVTVTVDATGRYHASFVVDAPDTPLPRPGARWGSTSASPTSRCCPTGGRSTTRGSPARAAAELRRAQQELARRQKGSANRRKSVPKVARRWNLRTPGRELENDTEATEATESPKAA